MSDLQSIAQAQRAFWNSEATRRWVTEQTRIDRLMAEVTDAALSRRCAQSGGECAGHRLRYLHDHPKAGRSCQANRTRARHRHI